MQCAHAPSHGVRSFRQLAKTLALPVRQIAPEIRTKDLHKLLGRAVEGSLADIVALEEGAVRTPAGVAVRNACYVLGLEAGLPGEWTGLIQSILEWP